MSIDNMKEIRDFITMQMERAAGGEITPAMANSSANLAGKLLSTFKLEMDYKRYRGEVPEVEALSEQSNNVMKLEHKQPKKKGKTRANYISGEIYQ